MDVDARGAEDDPGTAATAASKLTSKAACYFCGKPSYFRFRCPAKNTVCYKCGRKGHFAIVCRSTREVAKRSFTSASNSVLATMGTGDPSTAPQGARTESDCSPTTHGQEAAATPPNASLAAANPLHHGTIPVRVNNVYVNALIDSGSTSSFLHPDIMEELAITT